VLFRSGGAQINALGRKATAIGAVNYQQRVGEVKANNALDPQEKAQARRAVNADARAQNKAERMVDARDRGGKAEADIAEEGKRGGKIADRLKPPVADEGEKAEPAKPKRPAGMSDADRAAQKRRQGGFGNMLQRFEGRDVQPMAKDDPKVDPNLSVVTELKDANKSLTIIKTKLGVNL